MLWLWDLGRMIEIKQGRLTLGLLVLTIAGLSNFCQYLMSGPLFGGMSGVVYGLLGYIWIRGRYDPRSGLYLDRRTVVLMIIWFLVCFTPLFLPYIANTAHAVGLGMGMAWGFISSGRISRFPRKPG
jgi:GlpG protein